MVARRLADLRLRRHYGVYALAVHRRNQNLMSKMDDLIVQVGDTLLLEGAPADIQRLADEMNLLDVSKPKERAYRRGHAHCRWHHDWDCCIIRVGDRADFDAGHCWHGDCVSDPLH